MLYRDADRDSSKTLEWVGPVGALVSNWGHYDVSNNCGSAVNCQNMRKNCLFASVFFRFWFPLQRSQLQTSPAAARGPSRSAYNRSKQSLTIYTMSNWEWSTLPNCSKYERTSSMVVDADKPPTNSFLVLVTIWAQAHTRILECRTVTYWRAPATEGKPGGHTNTKRIRQLIEKNHVGYKLRQRNREPGGHGPIFQKYRYLFWPPFAS